jgi:hypothetical protein
MGAQETGLTLEGLAQRLEALTEKVDGLESENAGLRQELSTLRASGAKGSAVVEGAAVGQDEGRMSRRALLTKAGAAAVAATTTGMLLTPREARANHHAPGIFVDFVNAHRDGNNTAVEGNSQAGTGVFGIGKYGVWGESRVRGHTGVVGRNLSDYGYGVVGEGKGVGAGVFGRTPYVDGGYGVEGEGRRAGVRGFGDTGVEGEGASAGGYGGQFRGGIGVRGEGTGFGAGCYGGQFQGGTAQLRIVPKGIPGRPTAGSHAKGEVFMDSSANLFVCVAEGTPGRWRRVQTVAV